MLIRILAVPNSRASEVIGWEEHPGAGRVLRVKVAAPPVDGKANAALREILASHFKIPKTHVEIGKGASGRIKTLIIPDGTVIEP